MNEIELRRDVLISVQRALLGMIYPSIRGIGVGFVSTQKLKVTYFLDRETNELDYESISEVTTEVCADIGFNEVEEECLYAREPVSELCEGLIAWVYIRKETEDK